jgi:hypothetical protein
MLIGRTTSVRNNVRRRMYRIVVVLVPAGGTLPLAPARPYL